MIDPSLPSLLKKLHSKERRIINTSVCGFVSRLCLLDYLDCPDLFITDTGLIWSRRKLLNSRRDPVLYRNYVNLTYPDKYWHLPWVSLPTQSKEVIWLPVIQILGWSFYPQSKNVRNRYYHLKDGGILHADNLVTAATCDKRYINKHSLYRSYIDSIYEKLLDNHTLTEASKQFL